MIGLPPSPALTQFNLLTIDIDKDYLYIVLPVSATAIAVALPVDNLPQPLSNAGGHYDSCGGHPAFCFVAILCVVQIT